MRPLTAENEATLRVIAARHGYIAARGPHAGAGSASRLLDALLTGEVVTLALAPAERRRLIAWLDTAHATAAVDAGLSALLWHVAAQLRATLPADYDAHPGVGAIPRGRPAPPVSEGGEPAPDSRRRVDVAGGLRVENNSKFVRAKTKARAWVEDSVLRPHAMRKLSANKNEYVLTLTYGPGISVAVIRGKVTLSMVTQGVD